MLALPGGGWTSGDPPLEPPAPAAWEPIGTVHHVFTHFALALDILAARSTAPDVAGEWWPVADIAGAGLPTLFARAVPLASVWRQSMLERAA